MSDATKMVTVTCEFLVEIPVELDLDKPADYTAAIVVAAGDIHQRGYSEVKECIDDIRYE